MYDSPQSSSLWLFAFPQNRGQSSPPIYNSIRICGRDAGRPFLRLSRYSLTISLLNRYCDSSFLRYRPLSIPVRARCIASISVDFLLHYCRQEYLYRRSTIYRNNLCNFCSFQCVLILCTYYIIRKFIKIAFDAIKIIEIFNLCKSK